MRGGIGVADLPGMGAGIAESGTHGIKVQEVADVGSVAIEEPHVEEFTPLRLEEAIDDPLHGMLAGPFGQYGQ